MNNMITRIFTNRNNKKCRKLKVLFLSMFTACMLIFGNITTQAADRLQPVSDKVVIVIDPGHGGDNEGTKENGALEKSMTLKTAWAMYEELCKYDNATVYMTRTSDVGMSLEERAEYAASVNADFLFSIHYNASSSHELYGSEVWVSFKEPYYSYGYQFGCVQMSTMKDMGLLLRGVKTRHSDDKASGTDDYYGIIRHAVESGIPAAIIEHCHVDNANDSTYCDSDDDLAAFGRADALSVAKYFGLYSTELGVDYRNLSSSLADTSSTGAMRLSVNDYEKPDFCQIELKSADYDTGEVQISVSAADYSNLILYYDYSTDGGATYSDRIPWPDSNVITGTYTDTITVTLNISSGVQPDIIFRAYNMYDLYAESSSLSLDKFSIQKNQDNTAADGDASSEASQSAVSDKITVAEPSSETATSVVESSSAVSSSALPGTTTFKPDEVSDEDTAAEKPVSFMSFVIICLIIALMLIVTVIVSQLISDGRRRRRRKRRHRDNEEY
jgi:N-acetylmuramoyl-L-alanine amidase